MISLCLFRFLVRAQVLSVGRQPLRAIPRCSGPCGLPVSLRVASLIPRYSAAGPLRVCGSQGLWESRKLGCLTVKASRFIIFIRQALLALPSLLALQSNLNTFSFFSFRFVASADRRIPKLGPVIPCQGFKPLDSPNSCSRSAWDRRTTVPC